MKQHHKNIALIAGFVLAILLAYSLAFSKTAALKQATIAKEEAQVLEQGIAGNLKRLEQKELAIDSLLKSYNIKSNSIHNSLLQYLNSQTVSSTIKVVDFQPPHVEQLEHRALHSFIVRLEGSYPDLIKTIHQIEQEYNFGKVVHLNFEKKRDYRLKKDRLFCDLILQTIVSGK